RPRPARPRPRPPAPGRTVPPARQRAPRLPGGAMTSLLQDPLMQRALLVALAVGLAAPVVGTYLVQRRLSLLGDGIGHVALTGVAAGWLAGSAAGLADRSSWAVPGA